MKLNLNFFVRNIVVLASLLCASQMSALGDKEESIELLRKKYAQGENLLSTEQRKEALQLCSMLDIEGHFEDIKAEAKRYDATRMSTDNFGFHTQLTALGVKVWERMAKIAGLYRNNTTLSLENDTLQRLLKGVALYGALEHDRNPLAGGRFHGSCFAIPRDASRIYFSLYSWMNGVEKGIYNDDLLQRANSYLQQVAFQSWTQPLRNDFTDHQVISIARFRGHVWWVGGNALDYRPLLESALMRRSPEMIDVLHEVCMRSFSHVSQSTYDTSFWIEGMTTDGAGWGHGKQCLVWGYPIDGMIGAFRMLANMKNTAWDVSLSVTELDAIMNYVRGSSFYHYKGIIPPILDRNNMSKRTNAQRAVPATRIAETLLSLWDDCLSPAVRRELAQYVAESKAFDVKMENYPEGDYWGARYFFNNDDIIKKCPEYYLIVNMASNRVDGLESAFPGAAGFNFYANDGVTLFQRNGMEYRRAMGAFELNAFPGVTSRHSSEMLKPIVHWGGYTSKYNFAAGVPSSMGDFAAGFIALKVDARRKKECDTLGINDQNPIIFGVKSQKAYFMFDDKLLALGVGIENYKPNMIGDIVTTIDQKYSPQPFYMGEERVTVGAKTMIGKKQMPVSHDGFVYTVLPQYTTGVVEVMREERKTRWQELCQVNKADDEESVPVFQMQINHGRVPQNGSYAYVVDCAPQESRVANHPRVLSNRAQCQAAENSAGTKVGAVVYNPKSVIRSSMGTFKLSHPAAIMIVKTGNEIELTLTDSQMDVQLKEVVIETSLPLVDPKVQIKGKISSLKLTLPQGSRCGAPARFKFALAH